MSGRYSFSLPERRQRDGWFRIGTLDVTTTAFVVILGAASMVMYAIDKEVVFKGIFLTTLVRDGEVWRVLTWPAANVPDIWEVVGLAFFWFVGHWIEDETGKKPWAIILATMTVLPAVIVTLLNINDRSLTGGLEASSAGLRLLTIGAFFVFALDRPNMRFFFGIPGWVLAVVYVGVEVLRTVGDRAWAQLLLVLLVVVVASFGLAQRGWLSDFAWIPKIRRFAPRYSPYGEVGSSRPRSKGRWRGRPKRSSGSGSSGSVVAGPWGQQQAEPSGRTPVEDAELDILLDKIGAGGLDSLTPAEQARLKELSRRKKS